MKFFENMGIGKYGVLGLFRTNRVFWCLVASTILLLVGAVAVVFPSITGQLNEDRIAVARQQGRLSAVEAYQAEHSDYMAYEDELAKELAYRHRLLPQELTTAVIMGELQQKALGTGVELLSIKPIGLAADQGEDTENEGKGKRHMASVAVALGVRGTYFKCLEFIHAITASGQLLSIQTLQVNADPKQGGITCRLDIRAYGDKGI